MNKTLIIVLFGAGAALYLMHRNQGLAISQASQVAATGMNAAPQITATQAAADAAGASVIGAAGTWLSGLFTGN